MACVTPPALSKNARAEVDQSGAFFRRPVVSVGKTHAGTDGIRSAWKFRTQFLMGEERLEDRIGDGVFGQHRIDLFDLRDVDQSSRRFRSVSTS